MSLFLSNITNNVLDNNKIIFEGRGVIEHDHGVVPLDVAFIMHSAVI